MVEQDRHESKVSESLSAYSFRTRRFIEDKLDWTPWESGDPDKPGQVEIIEAYERLIKAQVEKQQLDLGEISKSQLTEYVPGERPKYVLRIPKGYNTGGTKLASGLVIHFLNCFAGSIVQTYAPTWTQIEGLLWKEILTDYQGSGLPGKVLPGALKIRITEEHFAQGRATQNIHGKGQEAIQGQHAPFLMFVIDEAEGVEDFVFKAIDKMGSSVGGGVVVVIMLANPRSRSSTFYKYHSKPFVENMRISCMVHPNVRTGKPLIPASVSRDWVNEQIEAHCARVPVHDPDKHTFQVPWIPGVIFEPDADFLYSVLGIASQDATINTVVPVGRFESAVERGKDLHYQYLPDTDIEDAWIGVDVARFGLDHGTIYVRWNGALWRWAKMTKKNSLAYTAEVRRAVEWLRSKGAKRVRVRFDGTGGFGSGPIDNLRNDLELIRRFRGPDELWEVVEVHFGAASTDPYKFANVIAQAYFETAETIRGLAVLNPPEELQGDLCDRKYDYRNYKGRQVYILDDKEDFRKEYDRSPDDGDGAALACAPDFIFGTASRRRTARVGAER